MQCFKLIPGGLGPRAETICGVLCAIRKLFIDPDGKFLSTVQITLGLCGDVGLFGVVVDACGCRAYSCERQRPRICKQWQKNLKRCSKPQNGIGCFGCERDNSSKPGTNGQSLKNILVFCQSIKSRLQAADRSAHGIDASNGGVGVDNGAFKKRPFGRKAVERTL